MTFSTLLAVVLLLQAPPVAPAARPAATKPATAPTAKPTPATGAPQAIPAAKSANIGPTVDVPAELAALVPTDAVAVVYVPSAADAEALTAKLESFGGPMRGVLARDKAVQKFLKTNLKTELEIPLDQPVLLWSTMPVAGENDPDANPMGGPDIRSYQAVRIPGATAENVKPRTKRVSVTILAKDMVVVSDQKIAYGVPAAGSAVCPLLKQLPAGAISGRLDLASIIREQEDNLRMATSFLSMNFGQAPPVGKDATEQEREDADMKQQMGAAISDQATLFVDFITELKSASFSIGMQGDQLNVWTDWTRNDAWPEGTSAAESAADLALLPPGMPVYAGLSRSTMGISLNKQVTFDDAMMTLGATDEQKKSWTAATEKMREVIAMMSGGVALGFGDVGGKPGYMIGLRVKDAATFQKAYTEGIDLFAKTGIYSEAKVERVGDTLTTTLTPDAKRLKRIASALEGDLSQEQIEAIDKSAKPLTIAMDLKGNNVTTKVTPDFGVPEGEKISFPSTKDIRSQINANAWGNTDWFASLDLRSIVGTMGTLEMKDFHLPDGPPALLTIRQGVQGGTQRISITTDVKSLGTLIDQYEKEESRIRAENRKKSPTAGDDAPEADAPDAVAPDASMPGAK
ncbi:MAG: hypothetical protein K8R92_05245 [Planctomycetes bacterium]|nr:hypothetical protein [Planctomycetota bacterium]